MRDRDREVTPDAKVGAVIFWALVLAALAILAVSLYQLSSC